MKTRIEYVWLDGQHPLPGLRSKTRYVADCSRDEDSIPDWNFDGGSTEQGSLGDSDRLLRPVRQYNDPFFEGGKMVMCEVLYHDGTPHESNSRSELIKKVKEEREVWVGFEQEFTLYNPANESPLGFLLRPEKQGPYYCGVGCIKQIGRYVLEEFERACIDAGLPLDGVNAEVMPGQWEFQTAAQDPLKASDDLWMARYILERVGEGKPVIISYDPKPHEDFNGAGCHTNLSTKKMRESFTSVDWEELAPVLEADHAEHIKVCGEGIEKRMTGECETSNYEEFSWGVGDRGASVRIPQKVADEGVGYFEDRRPCANIDPYLLLSSLISSINKSNLL